MHVRAKCTGTAVLLPTCMAYSYGLYSYGLHSYGRHSYDPRRVHVPGFAVLQPMCAAYIVMAYIVMAYIVMAYIVMAYTVMALCGYGPIQLWPYTVMALCSYGPIELWPRRESLCRYRNHFAASSSCCRTPTNIILVTHLQHHISHTPTNIILVTHQRPKPHISQTVRPYSKHISQIVRPYSKHISRCVKTH